MDEKRKRQQKPVHGDKKVRTDEIYDVGDEIVDKSKGGIRYTKEKKTKVIDADRMNYLRNLMPTLMNLNM